MHNEKKKRIFSSLCAPGQSQTGLIPCVELECMRRMMKNVQYPAGHLD